MQRLLDCGGDGCEGGTVFDALDVVARGLPTDAEAPFRQKCFLPRPLVSELAPADGSWCNAVRQPSLQRFARATGRSEMKKANRRAQRSLSQSLRLRMI